MLGPSWAEHVKHDGQNAALLVIVRFDKRVRAEHHRCLGIGNTLNLNPDENAYCPAGAFDLDDKFRTRSLAALVHALAPISAIQRKTALHEKGLFVSFRPRADSRVGAV